MKTFTVQGTLDLAPKIFIGTIVSVLLLVIIGLLAAMKLGYLAFDNGHLYFSQYKLVKVYGQIVNPAEIHYEANLEKGVQHSFPDIKQLSPSELYKSAQETVIRRKIMAKEAANRNITVTPVEVQTEINNRQTLMPKGTNLTDLINQYHWTEADLINQVSNQLLEDKVRAAVEGKISAQLLIIWPEIFRLKAGEDIANKAKANFIAGKDFQTIVKEASASAFLAGINFQYNEVEISFNTPSTGWNETILNFVKSLKNKEAKILEKNDSGGLIILVGYAKSRTEGSDFDTWYEQTKKEALSFSFLNFLTPKEVFAAGQYGPYWLNPYCGPAGSACIDSTTYIFGGGLFGCAALNSGSGGMYYCSNSNNCCSSHGYDTFCITLAGLQGRVYSDPVSRTPLSGVSVTATGGMGGCTFNYNNVRSASTNGSGYYGWTATSISGLNWSTAGLNCGGNPIGMRYVQGGTTKTQSVNIANGTVTTAPDIFMSAPTGFCGDNSCNNGETCSTCPHDCGTCGGGSVCGNGVCESGESCSNCPSDCGSCPVVCSGVSSGVSPNPVNTNSAFQISFSSSGGYTNVSVNPNGGASCGGASVSGSYTWTFNCTAGSNPGNYTATFNNDQGCTGSAAYQVLQPCIYPDFPSNPYPANGATQILRAPIFSWTESNWGNTPPYSVSVYLSPGSTINNGNYARCDQGQVTQANLGCFVWVTGPYAGQAVSILDYNTQYAWTVTPYDGCGVRAFDPTWTFTTIPTSYIQTWGGDVTTKGQIIDTYLPVNKYIGTKTGQ